ncbi:MAG: hypothetical protein HC808_09315 [Candidatus Competibacteraceae bacterium]|nr:hypothetical protein [Candidatus Competibacteraceae bacterium]
MIYPPHSPRSLLSRISPTLTARSGSSQHITVYRRDGPSLHPSFRERLAKVWTDCPELSSLREHPPERWILYSGRLGEGNPILLFLLDARGRPQVLVKVARFPGLTQLCEEERQLKAINERLDGVVQSKIITPLASAELDGRPLLAYRFEPCFPFFGLSWRLTGRANYLRCVSDWLAELAKQTRHVMAAAEFWEQHGEPLQRLLQRGALPTQLAKLAADAVPVLRDYQDKPFAVLEHGDLGFYNTRLTDRTRGDFKVLDWGSSDRNGVPLGDLCYLLASVNAPSKLAAECVGAYLDSIGYPRQTAWMLWLSYMARRWEELDRVRPFNPDDPYPGGAILLRTTDWVRRYFAAMGV